MFRTVESASEKGWEVTVVLRFLPEHYRVVVCASRQCTEREEERKNEAAAKKANFAFVHFNANDPAPPRSTLTVNDGRGRREREREGTDSWEDFQMKQSNCGANQHTGERLTL